MKLVDGELSDLTSGWLKVPGDCLDGSWWLNGLFMNCISIVVNIMVKRHEQFSIGDFLYVNFQRDWWTPGFQMFNIVILLVLVCL